MPDARHVSDGDLLRSIDAELPGSRQAAVEAHLAACETCRGRRREFERTFEDVADLNREESNEAPAIERRARFEASLLEMSMRMDRSWSVRMRPALPAIRLALACGASVAAALLLATKPLPPLIDAPDSKVIERHALPIASMTPGIVSAARADKLCLEHPPDTPPAVPAAVARQVLRAYGMDNEPPDTFELDYLITPELGGALDASNLWPQPYANQPWNAFVKDELERLLPELVCTGRVSLEVAQRDIATDWIAAYRKYFRTRDPISNALGLSRKFS